MASPMRSSLGGILHVNEGDAAVVLIHADREYAGNHEGPISRNHPDRRHVSKRDQHHHPIADFRAEFLGERGS